MVRVQLALFSVTGCVGTVEGEGAAFSDRPGEGMASPTPGRPTSPPAGPAGPATSAPGTALPPRAVSLVGPAPGRRLTRDEYFNSVGDILGIDLSDFRMTLPDETPAGGFRNGVLALVPSPMRTAAYETLASKIAGTVKWTGGLTGFAVCTDSTAACESGFVRALGRPFYRRALADREAANLVALFAATRAQPAPFETGARLVLEAILQSPFFLYRLERADQPAPSGTELATRLSYLFLKSTPPRSLLDAAERGELTSAGAVGRNVVELLQGERGQRGLRAYVEDWLQLHRTDGRAIDPTAGLTAQLLREMKEETLAFVSRVALGGPDLMAIFTDRTTDLGPGLAQLYGLAPTGPDMRRYVLPVTSHRIGILTQAAVLGVHAGVSSVSLVDRGVTVMRTFVCGDVPAPPDGVTTTLAAIAPTLSERERFAIHGADPACAGCHRRIDPLGHPFEPYDFVGRHRSKDQHGNTLRDDGVVDLDGALRSFADVTGFARLLGASARVEQCLVEKLYQYAFGRSLEPADEPGLGELTRRFRQGGRSYRALAEAVATSPGFLSPSGGQP